MSSWDAGARTDRGGRRGTHLDGTELPFIAVLVDVVRALDVDWKCEREWRVSALLVM